MMMTGVAPFGTSHGGATIRPPASIARRFSCERRAQSPSGTSMAAVCTSSSADSAAARRVADSRRAEEHAPAAGRIVFVDRQGGEVVEPGVQPVEERGIRWRTDRNLQGRVLSQRCL